MQDGIRKENRNEQNISRIFQRIRKDKERSGTDRKGKGSVAEDSVIETSTVNGR